MLSNCLNCRKNTESKNPEVASSKNRRIMFLSKFPVCDGKKSKFIRQQEASGLLSSFGIKTPLSKNPLIGPLNRTKQVNTRYKMIKIVKSLLAWDEFMPEMHFIVLVDHLQKTKKEYKNLRKLEIHDIFIKTN